LAIIRIGRLSFTQLVKGGLKLQDLKNGGPKKMKDMKMHDLKMTDQMSGHANAGPENEGPNVRA